MANSDSAYRMSDQMYLLLYGTNPREGDCSDAVSQTYVEDISQTYNQYQGVKVTVNNSKHPETKVSMCRPYNGPYLKNVEGTGIFNTESECMLQWAGAKATADGAVKACKIRK